MCSKYCQYIAFTFYYFLLFYYHRRCTLNIWYCNLVDDTTWLAFVPKTAAKTYLPPTCSSFFLVAVISPHMMGKPSQAPMSGTVPPLLLPLTTSSVCVCVSQPYPTSQSNSRCSCPSIHSSISSLLCRSLRLYLTVSLPSLRCAGSSVLSAAWNITLDWVLGSDAIAATASGEPHRFLSPPPHTHTQTDPQALTRSFCNPLLYLYLCSSCGLLFPRVSSVILLSVRALPLCNAGSGSLPVLSLSLSKAHCLALLHSSSCNTHLAALSGGW